MLALQQQNAVGRPIYQYVSPLSRAGIATFLVEGETKMMNDIKNRVMLELAARKRLSSN